MSVTAVPLRPIAKGSVARLWIGIVFLVVAAAALAWAGVPKSLGFEVLSEGSGPSPAPTDVALVSYIGTLSDGTVFDQSAQAALPVDGVMPGFSIALQKMQKGGHYKIVIPPHLGYGNKVPQGAPIPANATLTFDVKLLDFKSRDEIMRLQQQMQSQMQAMPQQGPAAGPTAPEGAPAR